MPAYNERETITAALRRLCDLLDGQPYDYEIIVVDDGSVDATSSMALEESQNRLGRIKVVQYQPNMGKGYALKTGFTHSNGKKIILLDSDLDIDPQAIPRYVNATALGDVAVGSKWLPVSDYKAPAIRKMLSLGFHSLVMLLTGVRTRDTQTGIKAFRRHALETIFKMQLVKRYAFDVELMTLANILKLTVVELPVRIHQQARFSLGDVFHMFIELLGIVYRARIIKWYQKNLENHAPIYKPIISL